MKKNILKIALFAVLFITVELIFAQVSPPNRRSTPPGLPIDGGLLTLFAVAFGYAIKKLRFKK